MNLTSAEKETIITFNEADKEAEVFTYNGRMLKDLGKLAEQRAEEVQCIKANADGSRIYRLPKKWVKIRASRILTEEQLERASERGKELARKYMESNLTRKS